MMTAGFVAQAADREQLPQGFAIFGPADMFLDANKIVQADGAKLKSIERKCFGIFFYIVVVAEGFDIT